MVRRLEAAEQALQEATHPVVHVGPGLPLCEPVEEVPVGVPVRLLETYVVAVLPVPPVLLPQPWFLAHPYELGVQVEGAERLVRTAVWRDVHTDAFAAQDLSQPFTGLLRLPPAPFRQGQGVVGLAFIDGVINIAR